MLNWTLAPSLATLRAQLNAMAPNRSKASDGTIGDAAHAKEVSDHNPDARGIVRAFDITHDPAHGMDGDRLAAALVASRDSRISYVIWEGRIARAYPKPGIPAWSWAKYTGADPHTNHVHLSVVADNRALNARSWNLTAMTGDDDMTPQQAQTLDYHTAQLRDVATRVNGVSAQVKLLAQLVAATTKDAKAAILAELDQLQAELDAHDAQEEAPQA